jgi:hypothetical protein
MAMLKKLLCVESFGGSINHLTYCQTILPIYLNGLDLPSVVQIVAFALLGCWALIVFALVNRFQQDDCYIFLDAVTHVEIDISPFQIAL